MLIGPATVSVELLVPSSKTLCVFVLLPQVNELGFALNLNPLRSVAVAKLPVSAVSVPLPDQSLKAPVVVMLKALVKLKELPRKVTLPLPAVIEGVAPPEMLDPAP